MDKRRKGTRHSKIIGALGEWIISDWLSQAGFEVAIVDHTGLDLLAYSPALKKRIGITVKSRTRTEGQERSCVNVFHNKRRDQRKLEQACKAFCCEPWIGVYVETKDGASIFLTPVENYYAKGYPGRAKVWHSWKMSRGWPERYMADSEVKWIQMKVTGRNWW